MAKIKRQKEEKPYRPYLGAAYKRVFLKIAAELNKTSMIDFDDLDVARHSAFELWKRVFPDTPFPLDADSLRKKYYKDVEL